MPRHELMLISEEGVVIRVKANDISKLGRSTQGVKVMNVSKSDRVSAIARVSAGKKRKQKKSTDVPEGQETLIEKAAEEAPLDEREAEAEALAAEEFEDEEAEE